MPFKKGQSGNPKGRPKIPEKVYDIAREHSVEAMMVLVKYMQDPNAEWRARQQAANAILDRAIGKPVQNTKLQDDEGNAVQPIIKVVLSSAG